MTTSPPDFAIDAAVDAARRSPCAKSKRGAAVYLLPDANPERGIYGVGRNGQPDPFSCAGTDACRAACGQLCLHAEHRAIRGALIVAERRLGRGTHRTLRGLELVHAKVVDGQLVAGGGPSCLRCSAEILDVGLDAVWLYELVESTGGSHVGRLWRRYTAEDFHRATAKHHELSLEVCR